MNIKSIFLLPLLSLLSLCSGDSDYFEVGETYNAEYSYLYDSFGYRVIYQQKAENIVSLAIKKSPSNAHKFAILHNGSLFHSVYVNEIETPITQLEAATTEWELSSPLSVYEVDFITDENGEESRIAYINIEFNTCNFTKLKFETDQTANFSPLYFLLSVKAK